jgi:hypothetical protein
VGPEGRGVEKSVERVASWSVLLAKYYSSYQIKKNELGVACAHAGERTDAYRVLVGKRDGKRLL